jgi:hypothetical protein
VEITPPLPTCFSTRAVPQRRRPQRRKVERFPLRAADPLKAQSPARNPYEPATLCFDHRAFENAGQPIRQRFI